MRLGGTAATSHIIKSVGIDMTLHDISPANLAIALLGSVTEIIGGTVTEEPQTVYLGQLTLTNYSLISSVVVKPATGTPTPYVQDTDYQVLQGGIIALPGGALTSGQSVKISYSYAGADVVQALTSTAKIWNLYFDGMNIADNARPVPVQVFRAQLGAAKKISLLGTDMEALEISGDVLKDTTITTVGLSQFFDIAQQST